MDPGTIVSAISCIAGYTVAPIVKQVKYVLDYKQNLTNLPKEVQELMDLKLEIEGLVSSARRNAEGIKDSVGEWMMEVDHTVVAARQMIRQEEEEQSRKRCFMGLCPNLVSRHRSSRKAFKETEQILQLQTAGKEFKEGSVSFPVSAVPSFPVTVTLGKDFLDFGSRSKTWEEIMKALKDPDANVIGVYGMGGLGKTTLVKHVVARAAEQKLFEEVVMPVVTQENVRDVKEFQGEMAKVLGMKLDDQWNQWNVAQRADRIFKRLTQKTADEKTEKMTQKTGDENLHTLVILDDLRAKLDLEQVGIPVGAGIKGCKILFTSRFQTISYTAQKDFLLNVLEEGEAWRLFQKIVGDALVDQAFVNIGKQVTENCKGLPILIVTVAGALWRRRSLGAWKDALIRLQREESREMQEFVDSALEFISFNHLPDANKSLFLLCGLLGGGEISIFDRLLKLGMGWGLFKHTKTVEEARNNLESLIHDLKASFLLLDGQSVDSVRMHDVVRDVAIKIASNESHNMLVGSSNNWPEDDVLRRCTALTFPYGIVPELPECLESPSLEFLLLYHNRSSLKITDNLFEKMQKLTVLDIRSVDLLPALPSSLALLQNLQTLSLNLCKLRDISLVGELKKLRILSLSRTDIIVLPMEIGNLSELRVLDLYGCLELKVIPPGIIQRLSRLEELHMAMCFSQWDVEGLASSERSNASLDELNYLVNLTTLRIHIPDTKLLPKNFSFEKLERFTILIGDKEWYWSGHDEQSLYRFRGIQIKINGSRKIHLEAGMQEMLKRTEILYLDGMKNIHELEWKSFQELKFVHIRDSAETRYIVNVMESFPSGLVSLYLSNLPQLQNLCRGMFMAGSSFSNLKYVDVCNCNSLRNLFSVSMARCLLLLEKVKVTNCNSLEAIVEDNKNGDDVMDKLEFRQLRSLILERLPKLASFYNSVTNSSMFSNRQKLVTKDDMESYETGSEDGCTIVAPFFGEKVSFPKLEVLKLQECDNMEYVFNQSIVTGLEQLNSLTITDCKSLKGIVARVEGEEINEMIKFPQLDYLFLEVLPCLTRFCSGCCIVFPTLTQLRIEFCWRLKTFVWADTVREDKTMTSKKLSTAMQPLFNEKVELPNLKSLRLLMVGSETIWHNHLHEDSFFKLELVDIRECKKLLKIFPSTMLGRIQGLETLQVWNNYLVEEVFENDETTKPYISRGETTEDAKIIFPQLRWLWLLGLSNLKRFCSGSRVVFPALTHLLIRDCKQMETFMYSIGVEDMGSNEMQPFFNEKVEFPSLKDLALGNLGNIKIIWNSRIHEDSFCALEQLSIWNCAKLLRIFPASIANCGVEKIVCQKHEEEVKEEAAAFVFPRLVTLILEGLPKLLELTDYGGDSFLIPILEKIEYLRLGGCPSILQGLVSCKFLTELEISNYDGSVLFSTAKTLVQLKTLKVTGCQMIEEILASDQSADEAEDAIVFSKLETLELEQLPSLVHFYPGNRVLKFPLLEQVTVMMCYNMKTFCGGITVTPKLKKFFMTSDYNYFNMEFEGDEWREEDKELNTLIKKGHSLTTGSSEHLSEAEDDTCENSNEPGTNKSETSTAIVKQDGRAETCEDYVKCSEEVDDYDDGVELRKEGEFCEEIVEPREEIDTCKARNEVETLPRPYLVTGSLAPTPDDTIGVTCPSSQTDPALGSANNVFQGLQVTQHLVPLLEKARDKHGDFHNSPSIKSKAVRITAMESVGQVLEVLQTQTPRTIDAEKIQFMEDAFHDLSFMNFPVEWLHPLIDNAKKWLRRKAKIEEMEEQLQALKREMEMEKALDQPLLDI